MKAYIHARLASEDRAMLERLKRVTGDSESELVRRGLRLVSQEVGEQVSALQRAGTSVGKFKRGPSDLGTNPRHLDGFGSCFPPGVLLDTGPLVALLSKREADHERAVRLFAACAPPLRSCDAVVAEACFLMRKVDRMGPVEIGRLASKGVYELPFVLREHLRSVEVVLKKYADQPISLADACLIRSAEVYREPRILTFDRHFTRYRWARNRRF